MKRATLFLSTLLLSVALPAVAAVEGDAPYPQIINVSAREGQSLDGWWHYLVDPQDIGSTDMYGGFVGLERSWFSDRNYYASPTKLIEYSFPAADSLFVPGDWNTQKEKLYYYEGIVWYSRHFDYNKKEGKRVFLYFGAANYRTDVALNGQLLGTHEGGFTPFNFEVTDILKDGDNSLVVKVDNERDASRVPCRQTDWWNYGGITRSVRLVETPAAFVRSYSVKMDPFPIGKTRGKRQPLRKIFGSVQLDGAAEGTEVTVSIPELKVNAKALAGADGLASFSAEARPELWSPESPKRYEVTISAGQDVTNDKIGFKYVSTQGKKLLLNGKEIFCKGVSMHEEALDENPGRITTEAQCLELLSLVKELGCNFVRLAHYPYNETMVRLADSLGVMIWEEIPVYWKIDWNNPHTYDVAQGQLVDIITRDINRACTMVWSVANETSKDEGRMPFLKGLIDKAREMDGTRLVSAAVNHVFYDKNGLARVNDPLAELTDLVSVNAYLGWYNGDAEICDSKTWTWDYDKPLFISEFGAGAKYGYHGADNVRFTEEYMAKCYEANIAMWKRVDGLCGCTPWILKDFRSARRGLPGIQDDFNRKGLVSEKGERKSAFYLMQSWYKGM